MWLRLQRLNKGKTRNTHMQSLTNHPQPGYDTKKKALRKSVRSEVERRGLTSYMNDTKWRELIGELKAHPRIGIKYKTLFDEKSPEYYWVIGGDEHIEHMDLAMIEWMKINPFVADVEYIGRLVEPRRTVTDFSTEVECFLKKHSIPYERDEAERIYMVYGWK